MKNKISILLVLALFIVPLTYVNAAVSPNVLTVEATQANGEISYTGTTEDGVVAVSCILLDSDNNEVDFVSSSVYNKAFSDKFVAEEGNYTIKCANYNGGTFVTDTVTSNKTTKVEKAPKTLDNINIYIITLVVSIIALLSIALFVKKIKTSKK